MNWWAQDVYHTQGAAALVSWVFWVIFSICLHELAHGVVAIWNGDRTPRELGHMTLNPIVHMGVPSLLVFAVVGIAWGMMPTDPSRYRRYRFGVITVAAAGPALNLLLSALCLTGAGVWLWAVVTGKISVADNIRVNVFTFLMSGGWLNILLAIFNLLPVPPLDGSRVLGGFFPSLERFFMQPAIQMYGMIVVLILFFSTVWDPIVHTVSIESFRFVGRVAHALPDAEHREQRGDDLDSLFLVTSPELQRYMREHPGEEVDPESVKWHKEEPITK